MIYLICFVKKCDDDIVTLLEYIIYDLLNYDVSKDSVGYNMFIQ